MEETQVHVIQWKSQSIKATGFWFQLYDSGKDKILETIERSVVARDGVGDVLLGGMVGRDK